MSDDEERCPECGEDHGESAKRAALAFGEVVKLMADPHGQVTPSVMFHIVGLLGALLVHYSEYDLDEIMAEVKRVSVNKDAVEGMYQHMVAVGLVTPDPDGGEELH